MLPHRIGLACVARPKADPEQREGMVDGCAHPRARTTTLGGERRTVSNPAADGKPREVARQGRVEDTRNASRVNTYAVSRGAATNNS